VKILAAGALVVGLVSTGCTSMAQVTTLSNAACYASFQNGITGILIEQKEDPQVASQLAEGTTNALKFGNPGPRPLQLSSSSGADYHFFVERKGDDCLLRLYGRQKGFFTYANNLTYIATQSLAPCQCSE
jgi:hypothetical protein